MIYICLLYIKNNKKARKKAPYIPTAKAEALRRWLVIQIILLSNLAFKTI